MMKKFIFSLAVLLSTMSFAQYPSQINEWGDEYYEYGTDGYYFPEDYYYEYPEDYYPNSYYRNFYRDYRRSITRVDWNRFFYEHNLSPRQIRLIVELNHQFDSYYVWEAYYRMNPARWYYDRFYALERILGPRIYVSFQTHYYRGMHPVVYYTNRFHHFYRTKYRVSARYRHYHPNQFRVDRNDYHQNNGRRYGWRDNRYRNGNGFRTQNNGFRGNTRSNYRNDHTQQRDLKSNSGFRTQKSDTQKSRRDRGIEMKDENRGFRNSTRNSTATHPHQRRASEGRRMSTSSSSTNANSHHRQSSSGSRGERNTGRR